MSAAGGFVAGGVLGTLIPGQYTGYAAIAALGFSIGQYYRLHQGPGFGAGPELVITALRTTFLGALAIGAALDLAMRGIVLYISATFSLLWVLLYIAGPVCLTNQHPHRETTSSCNFAALCWLMLAGIPLFMCYGFFTLLTAPRPDFSFARGSFHGAVLNTINVAGGDNQSFSDRRPSPRHQSVNLLERTMSVALGDVPLDKIWTGFFEQCYVHGCQALDQELLTREDVEMLDPKLFLGIPGLVILRHMVKSLNLSNALPKNKNVIYLMDGSMMDDMNRPKNPIFDKFFVALTEFVDELRVVGISGSPTDIRLRYLEHYVVSVGRPNPSLCKEANVLPEHEKIALGRIASRVQSYTTSLSQLPTFKSRFQDVCTAMTESEVFRDLEKTQSSIEECRRERAYTALV
eukprot:CAMPEP_0185745790 /NCGR_PEP_ID=MMETSP1174-20130828/4157_1 /TAXON_ID=35687 /ORGANISM="Dictyocha speculum, Strain CCMP1381" /LENGTH=404 /DNA_ID=CAMNT_0028420001 /DNA_START=135 /DNA_END=1349 /DNA_ORIENTATION=+